MKDLRNLPPEVMERLAPVIADDAPGDGARVGVDVAQRNAVVEARLFGTPEVRMAEDGSATVEGYATVYDYPYDVAGGAPNGWVEIIAPGACRKSVMERDRVGLLVNHDSDSALGLPLAATYANTLELESDDVGLRMSCVIQPTNVVSSFLIDTLRQGNADSMSFAFAAVRQSWNGDYTERTLTEVRLFDVSVVAYPANPAAVVQLRRDRTAPPAPPAGRSIPLARAQAQRLHRG